MHYLNQRHQQCKQVIWYSEGQWSEKAEFKFPTAPHPHLSNQLSKFSYDMTCHNSLQNQKHEKELVNNNKTRGDTCSLCTIVCIFVIEVCAFGVPSSCLFFAFKKK